MKIWAILIAFISLQAVGNDSIVTEPDTNAYNFSSHHRITIKAKPEFVWKHLKDFKTWMYDFEMALVSGTEGEEGAVYRLYSGEDFLVQIIATETNKLLVSANLPSLVQDEKMTGVAVITLNQIEDNTVLDLTMSRRFTWLGDGQNTMKSKRESKEYIASTRSMWNRFLERLKLVSENGLSKN